MAEKKIVIWNEFVHEKVNDIVQSIYPKGIHATIQSGLRSKDREGLLELSTATLDEEEHGLPQARLASTDVLLWWGHCAHDKVDNTVVDRIVNRVHAGMGFIALHSAHYSKPFKKLMGTDCSLKWRESGERERIWVCQPDHPIPAGIDEQIELENTEMYGEPFAIPQPHEQIFISSFAGGEVFRSGCCWKIGKGKVFYFRPGHETYPIYHHESIQRVIYNAVLWALP